MSFPVWIPLGAWRVHPHPLFELLAYTLAFLLYRALRRRNGDALTDSQRWTVIAAAIVGAVLGSKLLALLNDPLRAWQHRDDLRFLLGGKTIVGGLLGGWLAVEWIKRRTGITRSTGDLLALPLCVGIAVGRIGCFLSGLDDHTHGDATSLWTGIDLGDGVRRHPTALYEIAFLGVLAVVLTRIATRREGLRFRAFLGGYLAWRVAVDFVKPDHALLALSGIQWACLLGLAFLAQGARIRAASHAR